MSNLFCGVRYKLSFRLARFVLCRGQTLVLVPGKEEISKPPSCAYLFYENWSNETFRNEALRKWADCFTSKYAQLNNNGCGMNFRHMPHPS
jgi:hypothetical protein